MSSYDYDLFVIGAGSGGVACSRRAGAHGAKVGLCEDSRVGGTCVIRGCVPKKLLVYGTSFRHDFEDAGGFGWDVGEPTLSWSSLVANKDKEIERLENIYRRMLRDAGVDLIEGRGRLVDPHTVEVGGQRYTAANILIATGAKPEVPDIPGIEHVIGSNEALGLERLPERMVIVGGGYIGCEFASIFNAAGATVTQVVRSNSVLRGFDEDVRTCLAAEMARHGVELRVETLVRSIEQTEEGYSLRLAHGEFLQTDLVMYATGRIPNTADLGLEQAGVELGERGRVVVDRWSRSSVENVYAVGDVTDRMALTPVAIMEGRALAETLFNETPTPVAHEAIPHAVFAQPPVSVVGLTEHEARARHEAIDVYRARFRPMKHTLSGRGEQTLMKLLVQRENQRVLGCHMVGDDAPEIIQGLAVALRCGATKEQFDATVGIHPTAAEEFVTMRDPVPEPEP